MKVLGAMGGGGRGGGGGYKCRVSVVTLLVSCLVSRLSRQVCRMPRLVGSPMNWHRSEFGLSILKNSSNEPFKAPRSGILWCPLGVSLVFHLHEPTQQYNLYMLGLGLRGLEFRGVGCSCCPSSGSIVAESGREASDCFGVIWGAPP